MANQQIDNIEDINEAINPITPPIDGQEGLEMLGHNRNQPVILSRFSRALFKVYQYLVSLSSNKANRIGDTITVNPISGLKTQKSQVDDEIYWSEISTESGYTLLLRRNDKPGKSSEFIGIDWASRPLVRVDSNRGDGTYRDYFLYHQGFKPSKTDVGLSNVDNTSDSEKDVLTATKLKTARNITIGNTKRLFDGGSDITYSISDLGALINSNVNNINIDNFKSSSENGFYLLADGCTGTLPNGMFMQGCLLINFIWDRNTGYQELIYGGVKWKRKLSANAWQSWYKIYTEAEKPSKGDVGLSNVDNTSDSEKNVLTATKLKTARNISIGYSSKAFDGGSNLDYSLFDIRAAVNMHNITVNIDEFKTAENNGIISLGNNCTGTYPSGVTTSPGGFLLNMIWDRNTGYQEFVKGKTKWKRTLSSNLWSEWKKVYTEEEKPTPSEIGAVATNLAWKISQKEASSINTNLDLLDSGFYYQHGGTDTQNRPSGIPNIFALRVEKYFPSEQPGRYGIQHMTSYLNREFSRAIAHDGATTGWQETIKKVAFGNINENIQYAIYSDGTKEIWGYGNGLITFPFSFSNVKYGVGFCHSGTDPTGGATMITLGSAKVNSIEFYSKAGPSVTNRFFIRGN